MTRQVWTETARGDREVAGSVRKYVGETAISMGATRERPIAYAASVERPTTLAQELGAACSTYGDARAYVLREYRYNAAAKDASLGVGHVWNRPQCPAYRSYDPAACTCAVQG